MSGARSMYNEVDDFFGSKQGRLFVALNYKGTNFSQPLNTKENPETIRAEPMFQLLLAKNYNGKEKSEDNVLSQDFVDFVKAVAAYHKTLDVVGTQAGAQTSKLAAIYSNWANISDDGRQFFSQLMNLVSDSNSNIATQDPRSVAAGLKLRLNLKKVDPSQRTSEVIFGRTLPYLPAGMIAEDKTSVPVDHLHRVYDAALRNTTIFTGGAANLFEGWTNLNVSQFLRNCLYVQKQINTGRIQVTSPLDEVYDLVTSQIYSVDANGNLVNKTGRVMDDKAYADDVKENCFGTQLKDCDLVFECLLSGDPKALSRCLGKLSIERMYDVAKTEVAKMNPRVMAKVLGTFDIQTDKHGRVEEYIQWRGSLESRLSSKMGNERGSKTAAAILGNKKLLEYLRNIMDVIRSNNALVQGKSPLSDLPDKTDKKISYFIKPQNIDRATALSTQLGTLVQQLNVMPQNFVSSLNMPLQLSNVGFGANPFVGLGALGMLRGGGCVDDTVATMESIYRQILEEMKAKGKDLVDEDKKRIETAIEQIKKNNLQLTEALKDLKAFMKLNTALTAGINNVSLNDVKGSSKVDLNAQVGNLESCINRTSREQVGLITALVDQVFRPMALIASGSSSTLLRPYSG
jgi:hypothetical protein